jgi:predicted RND superfamily exporter protein
MINHIRLCWMSIAVFFLMAILSIPLAGKLQLSFDFNQFFPKGDPDLQFYEDFMDDFGADDSFLRIAIRNEPSVFNQSFLNRFHKVSRAANKLPSVRNAQSLTTLSYPLRTSMGFTALPVIHLADSIRYTEDWEKIRSDKLLVNQLIDSEAKSVVLALETEAELGYPESVALMNGIRDIMSENGMVDYYIMGRASFYQTIVDMQKRSWSILRWRPW